MERKRTIFWDDPKINKRDAATSISGLDYLRAIKDGRINPRLQNKQLLRTRLPRRRAAALGEKENEGCQHS